MNECRPARRQDQTAIRPARECHDGALDLGSIGHVDRNYLYADRRRHWIEAHWPIPPVMAESRMTATRVTPGATSLSSSNHFPLVLYAIRVKPVALRPGRARLSTNPSADRAGDVHEHDRHGAGRLQQRPYRPAASGQDDVRCEREQFCQVFTSVVGIAGGPAGIRALPPSIQPTCWSPCRNAARRACTLHHIHPTPSCFPPNHSAPPAGR